MKKVKRYTWEDFAAKMDYEGVAYMIQELGPDDVPKELADAQMELRAAFEIWDDIVQSHLADLPEFP